MDNKNKIIIVIIVLALIILCGGLTFAYFTSQTNNESGSTIVVKGGTMTVVYAGGTGDIIVENIYPRDEEWANKTFTVTGNNSTELDMDYRLYLVTTSNDFNFGDLTYTISGTSTNASDTLIQKSEQKIPKNGELLLGSGIFKSNNATHSYSLKIYYKENNTNQNNGQGKNYTGYVRLNNGNVLTYDTLINLNNAVTSSESTAFNGPVSISQVESIVFNNTNTVPSNAIESWDAGEKQTGSIMAYILDEDNDGLYELYIGQSGTVKLGLNASYLFSNYNNINNLNVCNLDTSATTNMEGMFKKISTTSVEGLTKFNTSNVTNMSYMFSESSISLLNLKSFVIGDNTDISHMFLNSLATLGYVNGNIYDKVTSSTTDRSSQLSFKTFEKTTECNF